MDEEILKGICSNNVSIQAKTPLLEQLMQTNSPKFSFPDLNKEGARAGLWAALFHCLQNPAAAQIHALCLANIRILSRDKENLDDIVCQKWINTLLELSGLYQLTVSDDELPTESSTEEVKVEALKCLCNLIYNSPTVQNLCESNCLTDGLVARLRTWKDENVSYEIKYFDMRLLFIITAVKEEKRSVVKDDLHGLAYLTESLDDLLRDLNPLEISPVPTKMVEGDLKYFIDEKNTVLICEILKTLFNIILPNNVETVNEQDEPYILRLISICSTLLLCSSTSKDKTNEIHNNAVNLLTGVPGPCYSQLAPVIANETKSPTKHAYDGRDMTSIYLLAQYLDMRISQTQNTMTQYDNLSPILSVMHRAASSHSYLRKYLRVNILPPLKDIHTRPEEGNTIRNKLCRLLTTPITHIRDLAAQFLFILCKENVARMVKYTGYGNAAGLFATKGLLGLKPGVKCGQYSSDSEDSDTEEYKAMKHTVNPVTGCYEPPHPDPMAGCTEEQKEYEAMKLVHLMDQLHRSGMIQPCRIGPDGKPEPVEHILQLQEDLPNQQVKNNK